METHPLVYRWACFHAECNRLLTLGHILPNLPPDTLALLHTDLQTPSQLPRFFKTALLVDTLLQQRLLLRFRLRYASPYYALYHTGRYLKYMAPLNLALRKHRHILHTRQLIRFLTLFDAPMPDETRRWQTMVDRCDKGDIPPDLLAGYHLYARTAALRQLAAIATALTLYQSVHNAYPPTLCDLVPGFLPQVPRAFFEPLPVGYHTAGGRAILSIGLPPYMRGTRLSYMIGE